MPLRLSRPLARFGVGLSVLLAAACSAPGSVHPGWLMATSTDGTRATLLSERFEFTDRILADRVGMLFSITLGPERLPARWQAPPGPGIEAGRIVDRSGRIIEEVYEIVFLNLSEDTVTFSPQTIRLRSEERVPLLPTAITLKPRESVAVDPIVRIGSVYQRPEHDFAFSYEAAGLEYFVTGSADRLAVTELEQRQRAGLAWRFK